MSDIFEILPHTADIRLKIYGKTKEELFANGAKGMFSLITEPEKITPMTKKRIAVQAQTMEDLLVEWLKELLYIFNTKKLLFKEFNAAITKKDVLLYVLNGYAKGEVYKKSKHQLKREIKAVTYHDVKIRKNKLYTVEVIFDV